MNCIENTPHNTRFKWSSNEFDSLAYDIGNMSCRVKIKIKYLA